MWVRFVFLFDYMKCLVFDEVKSDLQGRALTMTRDDDNHIDGVHVP